MQQIPYYRLSECKAVYLYTNDYTIFYAFVKTAIVKSLKRL